MSKTNWLYDSIFGADEPTQARPVPAIPIIDTREILYSGKRTSGLTAQLERVGREEAIKAVCGAEVFELIKNPVHPVTLPPAVNALRPPISTNTFDPPRRTEARASLPEPSEPDPYRQSRSEASCSCECPFCQFAGDHRNCCGNPRCSGAHPDMIDRMQNKPENDAGEADADEEIRAEFLQAARDRQIAKHRAGLKPAFDEFAKRVGCSGVMFNLALDRATDSMAQYITDVTA